MVQVCKISPAEKHVHLRTGGELGEAKSMQYRGRAQVTVLKTVCGSA